MATKTEKTSPSTTTITSPTSTHRIERITRLRCPVTMPSAMPRIGVPSGAMIMAPMTVAVESVSTPAIAIDAGERQHDEEAGALAQLVAVARGRARR